MKSLKKTSLVILLIIALVCTGCCNVICLIGNEIGNMDTPIAKIEDDNYLSYADRNSINMADALRASAEAFDGRVENYASESEYIKAQENIVNNMGFSQQVESSEPVKMMIQLLDRLTDTPISNAIVRLNGVPRFSNRDGIVAVTLTSPVYELYVTKETGEGEQYNPYMEFIYTEDYATVTTKTIKLKRPSDDLDITSVNLRIGSALSGKPEYYNLLAQEYHFATDYMDYPADIIVETNNPAEYCMLYRNGELDRTAVDNDFIFFDYNKKNADGTPYYKKSDKFSIKFVYSGIESKTYDLLLYIEDIDDVETPDVGSDKDYPELGGGPNENQDMGLFGEFNIDFKKFYNMIDDLIMYSTKGAYKPIHRQMDSNKGTWGPKITAIYNPRNNTLELVFGVEFNKRNETNKTQLQKLKEFEEASYKMNEVYKEKKQTNNELAAMQNKISDLEKKKKENIQEGDSIDGEIAKRKKSYEKMTEAYYAAGRLSNEGAYEQRVRNGDNSFKNEFKDNAQKLVDIRDQLSNANGASQALLGKLDVLKSLSGNVAPGTGFVDNKLGIVFNLELVGRWKINLSDNSINEFKISGQASVKISYTAQFIVLYIPIYARVEGGLMGRVDITVAEDGKMVEIDKFWYGFLLTFELSLRGDIGIGLYDVISIGGFAKGGLKFGINMGEVVYGKEFEETYGKFYLQIGVKATLLFLDYEFTCPDNGDVWNWYLFGSEENAKMQARTMSSQGENLSNDDVLFESCYQDARPQLTDLGGGNMLMTWLADKASRDGLNRTELQYSLFKDGVWSDAKSITQDSGCADFYPQVYMSGNDIYIAWQRANRQFTTNDDIRSMSAAGEIWTAKFDAVAGKFIEQQQITHNEEMDLMPKFAVRENINDPLVLVWQKNSLNDMLGMQGSNSIVSSTYTKGNWSNPKTLYTSDNVVAYVSASVLNGATTVAFVEDKDKDPLSANDREIKAITNGATLYSDKNGVANPQFAKLGNKTVLYYYKEGNIVYTEDFVSRTTAIASESDEFALGFRVVSDGKGTVIYYEKNGEETKQSYCAVYDSASKSWTNGINLSDTNGYANASTGFLNSSGEIVYVYSVTNEAENYTALCYGVKNCKYGITINEAFYLGNIVDGEEFTLAVTVKNTGDYGINSLSIEAFGQKQLVDLDMPLLVGEERSLIFDFVAHTEDQTSETITVCAINGDNVASSAEYILFYGYVDYALNAELVINDGVQQANIIVNSASMYNGIATINIYVNGQIIETMNIDNLCASGKSYEMSYIFKDVKEGDYVYIEVVSRLEKITSNNSSSIKMLRNSKKEKPQINNPYEDALNTAKRYLV